MSGRSPSTGVASLRARFEQNREKTSPPSRGRSLAGSVTSDSSRPLSKVRTSFVAVEPSWRMGLELGLKEAEKSNEALAGDGVGDGEVATEGEAMDKPKTNGALWTPEGPAPAANLLVNVTEDKAPAESSAISNIDGAKDDALKAYMDKPVCTTEDNTVGMLPSDSKDARAVSGGTALADQTPGLGSILKGSPFEDKEAKEAKKASAPKFTKHGPKSSATTATRQAPKSEAKAPIAAPVNGKPNEAQASKAPPQSMPAAGAVNGKPKEAEMAKSATEVEPKATAPAPIETHPATSSAPSNATDISTAEPKKANPRAPRTPTSATTPTKQPSPKKTSAVKEASPKAAPAKEAPKKDAAKEIKKPISRLSGVSQPRAATASKPLSASAPKPAPASSNSTAKPPVKKTGSTSPSVSAFTKHKPKSPTRPVKLPASATASTAASAAKLDGTAPSMGDRKPVNMASHAKDKASSSHSQPKPKTGRASMPGGSKPAAQKPTPKPRTSMASTKAPEGGFLERMMRPTQSSAQKTHEKVEPRSPPRKTAHLVKPKGTGDGDHGHLGHGDMNLDKLRETSARAGHPLAEASEGPTQSSAKKTHEKVETKSPLRKTAHPVKPKGISDGDHGHLGHGDISLDGLRETSARAGHPSAEVSEGPTQSSAKKTHDKAESKGRTAHAVKPKRTSDGDHGNRSHRDIDLEKHKETSAPAGNPLAEASEAPSTKGVEDLATPAGVPAPAE